MNNPASSKPAIAYRTAGLTKVYGEGTAAVHALRGVDLEIPSGEIIVLLGPSGSGKSTLLNIIGGLDRATDGEAWFQDQLLTEMEDAELTQYRRENVGRAVLKVLKNVNDTLGSTILMVTHAAATAEMAHRVINFADGDVRDVTENKTRIDPEDIEW